jgi:hypothetical protein
LARETYLPLFMRNGSSQFEGLLDNYFESVLEESPISATYVGIKSGEGKFGRNTLETETRREKRRQAALRKLESISPRDLTNEQHLDRLALRSQLLRESEDFARGRHTMDPSAPETVLNILLHELTRGEDEPKRGANNVRSLLRLAPQYLEESLTQIDKPERVWVKILEQTTGGAETLYKAVETFLQRVDPQSSDKTALNGVRRSIEKFKSKAQSRPSAPESSFSIGPIMLQRRIRDQLGLDYTLGEVETLALSEVDRVNGLLREACAKFGKKRSPEMAPALCPCRVL